MNRAFLRLKLLNEQTFRKQLQIQHQVLFRTERSITQQIKAKQATIPSIAVIPSILTSHLFLRARSYHSNDRNSVSINLDRHQW